MSGVPAICERMPASTWSCRNEIPERPLNRASLTADCIVSETGDHAKTGDDDPLGHYIDPVFWNRPTRRSEAV